MFTIGEFAQLTDITVKALHHYDEVGLLHPAEVDPATRYRRYAAEQVRQALLIRALRDADVPLNELADVIDETSAVAALERHRANQIAARQAQDLAHQRAGEVIKSLAARTRIEDRDVAAQPFIGAVISLDESVEDDHAGIEARFGALHARALQLGGQPTGELWTTLRTSDRETLEMVICLAVDRPLEVAVADPAHVLGELPIRREIVASWISDQADLVDGVLHPVIVSILEELEARGLSTKLDSIRQINKPHGGIEVAVALPAVDRPRPQTSLTEARKGSADHGGVREDAGSRVLGNH